MSASTESTTAEKDRLLRSLEAEDDIFQKAVICGEYGMARAAAMEMARIARQLELIAKQGEGP